MFSKLFNKKQIEQSNDSVNPYNYKGLFNLVIIDKDSSYQGSDRVVSWIKFGIRWKNKQPLLGLYDYGYAQEIFVEHSAHYTYQSAISFALKVRTFKSQNSTIVNSYDRHEKPLTYYNHVYDAILGAIKHYGLILIDTRGDSLTTTYCMAGYYGDIYKEYLINRWRPVEGYLNVYGLDGGHQFCCSFDFNGTYRKNQSQGHHRTMTP